MNTKQSAAENKGLKYRDRFIGRRRRRVRWAVIENLIVPNWQEAKSGGT
jgi:hypothetical protein